MGDLKENQQVKLSFKLLDGIEKELAFRIKSFSRDRISLKIPQGIDDYINYLQEGDEVKAQVFTPQGIKIFDAMILNSPLEADFIIEYVENSIKVQRREFLRVPMKIKIVLERENKEIIVTETLDVSGGGIKFLHEGEFLPDEKVKFTLYFPDERFIQGYAVILPSNYLPCGQYAMEFKDINENDRDRIIKKCFEV